MLVTLAAFGIDRVLDYPNTLAGVGFILAIHAIGTELPPRRSMQIGVPVTIAITIFTLIGAISLDSVGADDVVFTGAAVFIPLLLGREVHLRRRRFQEMSERAERAEREREEQARQAVAEERSRIARELHDVVAHQMAVMTLQAEGARRLASNADPRVVAALDTIKDAGHQALTEMRRMVGLLRTDGDAEPTALDPQPGIGSIDQLVAGMREAGLAVDLTERGERPRVSDGVGLNVYRIVQESLTNTLKHGGPNVSAVVALDYGPDCIDIEVTDDGRGAAALGDSGHGLVGMRERVALLDGRLEAGPKPGGGYRVSASIPVDA